MDFAPTVLPKSRDYDALYNLFRWQIPLSFNIGVAVCDAWAARDPRRAALIHVLADGARLGVDFRPDLGVACPAAPFLAAPTRTRLS